MLRQWASFRPMVMCAQTQVAGHPQAPLERGPEADWMLRLRQAGYTGNPGLSCAVWGQSRHFQG